MKLSFVYIFLLIAVQSCKEEYHNNKFIIKAFNMEYYDSNSVQINFDVRYFSDSTENDSHLPFGAKELGLDGSNDSIVFFGYDTKSNLMSNANDVKLDSFKTAYNKHQLMGQNLDFPIQLESIPQLNKYLILVLRDKRNGNIDTLKAQSETVR